MDTPKLTTELKNKIMNYLIDNNLLKYHNCWKLVFRQPFMQDFLEVIDTPESNRINIVKKFIQQGRGVYLHKRVSDSFGKLTTNNLFDLLHRRPNHNSIIIEICADGTTLSAEEETEIRAKLDEMIGNGEHLIELMTNILTGNTTPEELEHITPLMSKATMDSLGNAQKACEYLIKLTSGEEISKEDIEGIDRIEFDTKMQETLSDSNNGFTRLLESVQATGVCATCEGIITSLCSNCKIVGYCSKECQIKHWKVSHKKKCAKLYNK